MTTILIVDDNKVDSETLSRRLKRRGYEVLVATDSQTEFDAARVHVPDLILTDGSATARRLKADPALKQIPVLALTKPIELTPLLAKIVTLMLGAPALPHPASVRVGRLS